MDRASTAAGAGRVSWLSLWFERTGGFTSGFLAGKGELGLRIAGRGRASIGPGAASANKTPRSQWERGVFGRLATSDHARRSRWFKNEYQNENETRCIGTVSIANLFIKANGYLQHE